MNSVVKRHWGRIVALLNQYLQDIDLAEDAMQDALESACRHWGKNGIPENAQAWLFTTAKHKAIDKIRRSNVWSEKQQHYQDLITGDEDFLSEDEYYIPEERLRLIFTCCHPALDKDTAVALTLKLLCGLQIEEIAKALLVKPKTLAQRLVRGKKKIKLSKIPYHVPSDKDIYQRLDMVMRVIYLIFNEGYSAAFNEELIRQKLSDEAIRLGELLLQLQPDKPEVEGLLALMYLHDARRKSRYDHDNGFVPLSLQNRRLWNTRRIKQGCLLLERALTRGCVGFYQLQAAISAVHNSARDYQLTDWKQIILLYEKLLSINNSAVIKLNQLVALSQLLSKTSILTELQKLQPKLTDYQPFYAFKADLLHRMDEYDQAHECYRHAITLTNNAAIRRYLQSKIDALNC